MSKASKLKSMKTPKVRIKFSPISSQMESSQNSSFQSPSGEYKDQECGVSIEVKVRIPATVYGQGPRKAAEHARRQLMAGKFSAIVTAGLD